MRRTICFALLSLCLLLFCLPLMAQETDSTPDATAEGLPAAEVTPQTETASPAPPQTSDDPRAIRCRKGKDAFAWHMEEGGRRRGRQQNYEAYQQYNCAVQLDPYSWLAYRGRAITLYAQNNFQGALSDLDVAIDLAPKENSLYYWRATVLHGMGENDAALKAIDQSVKLDPGYALAFNLRGIIHRDLEQYDLAIQDFNIAISTGVPDSPQTPYLNLGHLYLDKLDNRVEAVVWYEEAARVAPGNAAIYELLGNNYLALNRIDDAERSYMLYVDLENTAKESVLAVVEAARLRQLGLRYAPSLLIVAIVLYFIGHAAWRSYRKRNRPEARTEPASSSAPMVLSTATPLPDDPAASLAPASEPSPDSSNRTVTALILVPLLAGAAYVLRRLAQPAEE